MRTTPRSKPIPPLGTQTSQNVLKAQEIVNQMAEPEDQSELAQNISKLAAISASFDAAMLEAVTHRKSGCVRMMVPFSKGKPRNYEVSRDFPVITKTDIADEE